MASITLTQAYFHSASDLSDYDAFDVHTVDPADEWDADRRVYTSGRLRLVTGDVDTLDVTLALRNMSRAGRETLRARGGVLQLLRLPEGYRRYGFFNARGIVEQPGMSRSDVTLVFREITVNEAV